LLDETNLAFEHQIFLDPLDRSYICLEFGQGANEPVQIGRNLKTKRIFYLRFILLNTVKTIRLRLAKWKWKVLMK